LPLLISPPAVSKSTLYIAVIFYPDHSLPVTGNSSLFKWFWGKTGIIFNNSFRWPIGNPGKIIRIYQRIAA
jgi:hypothetical protein